MQTASAFCCGARKRQGGRRLAFEQLESRQLLAVTTLSPVADTFTQAGVGAGSVEVLDVVDANGPGDRVAYVCFDISGVVIANIKTATLTFYKLPGTRSDRIVTDRFDVYGLTNDAGNTPQDWDEAMLAESGLGAEYTNTGGDGLDTARLFNLDQESGAEVFEDVFNGDGLPQSLSGSDLLDFLYDRASDDGLVTFITLVDAGNNRGWGYGSRENSDPNLRPILELDDGQPIPDPYPENPTTLPHQMERLDRGIVAVRSSSSEVYVGWRLLGNDPPNVAFNLYRSTNGGPAVQLNDVPMTQTTDFVDDTADVGAANEYFVRTVIDGDEQEPSESFILPALSPVEQYLSVPLDVPSGGQTPDGENYTFDANDASVGDLDGDGQYEIVLKWQPTNAKANSQAGYTGPMIVDAYELDGTRLWRIDVGINVRSGAQYTPFVVYDLDGDGKAEVAMRAAPGTTDGLGNDVILPGDDPDADYRDDGSTDPARLGHILTGSEYLTIFNGQTGAEMVTVPHEPFRGDVETWGDSWGNRSHKLLMAVAYLDGIRPSLAITRGHNGPAGGFSTARTDAVAYNWRNGELEQLWHFKGRLGQENNINVEYVGQGNHNLSIADVDGDGLDEIIYGAIAIDHDGTGLYSTGLGHGDAIHVSDMDPTNPGLEVFQPHEDPGSYGPAGGEFRDALTGELLLSIPATNDVGRGVAFDIDPNYLGYEMWAATNPRAERMVFSAQGEPLYSINPDDPDIDISYNFGVWWDADPLRELLDSPDTAPPTIAKWRFDAATPTAETIFAPTGVLTNNGTKATPALSADLFGDWREEVMVRSANNDELRIYTTTIPTTMRLVTLMHDRQYREAIAWQNAGYNQPPHPSFYLGDGMELPPQPSIYFAGQLPGDYNDDGSVDAADYTVWRDDLNKNTILANDTTPGRVTQADYDVWVQFFGTVAPSPGNAAISTSILAEPISTIDVEKPIAVARIPMAIGVSALTEPDSRRVARSTDGLVAHVKRDRIRSSQAVELLFDTKQANWKARRGFNDDANTLRYLDSLAQEDGPRRMTLELVFAELGVDGTTGSGRFE